MLLVIQGLVDRQRIERRNAYLIHCSMCEKPVDMLDWLPLPYDSEIRTAEAQQQTQDVAEWYKAASGELANFNWNKPEHKN